MPYVPIDRFLVRAPLLRGLPFGDAAARLRRDPLGARALALASPSLAAHPTGERADRALDRYARRAAFRATPAGLLAGVTVGTLGTRTGGATGQPRPHLLPSWARVARLGRALLEDAVVRRQVYLRHAPSLLRGADRIRWLALGAPAAEEREADLDARLARILDASRDWTPWQTVRAAAQDGEHDHGGNGRDDGADDDDDDDDADADELLLLLIDDGLLHHDLAPPLVGPPASVWMAARLEALQPRPAAAEILANARAALEAGDLAAGQAALRALPGAAPDGEGGDRTGDDRDTVVPDLVATLVHQPSQAVTLDRATVERAAALAPLLFRLQQALTPPAAERLLDRGALDALATASELFGEGALDPTAWQLGDYGVDPAADIDGESDGGSDRAARSALPPPGLLRWLVDEIVSAAAARRPELVLDPAALDRLLPALAPPPTCELFLTPTTTRAGWLLGMHAPAGASWGRFSAALGGDLDGAFAALDAAERAARPRQHRLDVAYAPSEALADLCAHSPVRSRQLALSTWPARTVGEPAPAAAPGAVVAAGLGLIVTAGLDAPALSSHGEAHDQKPDEAGDPQARQQADRQEADQQEDHERSEVIPSPLARVRSTTAPAGLFRLLAGFSLYRQHAPWALSLGALADLAYVPRVSIDGFVVSPASWRLPPDLDARALRRWRRGRGDGNDNGDGAPPPPRFVQVGAEDELLPVDLDAPQAWRDLAGQPRAWEIWPPLDEPAATSPRADAAKRRRASPRARTVDRDGRRIEAVVALVDVPDDQDARRNEARHQTIRGAGPVPPPRLAPAPPGWRTFSLYGVEQRQDDLLLDTIAPAVRQALDAGEIDHWFFVRYADASGRRPHLRLRVHAADRAHADAFAQRLDRWLRGARAAGAVALVESAGYHPEVARFGGHHAMAAALRIFESDSNLTCALLAVERAPHDPAGHLAGHAAGHPPGHLPGPGHPDNDNDNDSDNDDDRGARPDQIDRLVATFDSLTTGLGLALPERHALARRRRHAEATALIDPGAGQRRALDADFRARAAALRDALSRPSARAGIGQRLAAHRAHVRAAVRALPDEERVRLAPPLLHLSAVRLLGADREAEARAYLFWERTLEGLVRSPPEERPTPPGKSLRRSGSEG